MIDYQHCRSARIALSERNDCVVRACAVATQRSYTQMRSFLAFYGRKHGQGMHPEEYHKALLDIGYTLERLTGPKYLHTGYLVQGHWVTRQGVEYWKPDHYRYGRKLAPAYAQPAHVDYKSATVAKLKHELTSGTYLVNTQRHVLCLRDGVVHDYTRDKRTRIRAVYRVTQE